MIRSELLPMKWLKAIDAEGMGDSMVLLPQKGGWQYRVGTWRDGHYVSWVTFDDLYQSKLQRKTITIVDPDGQPYRYYASKCKPHECSVKLV